MTDAPTPAPAPVQPGVALVFATVGFFALVIAGLGLTSLALDEPVIDVPGAGQAPGIASISAALVAFAGMLAPALVRGARSAGAPMFRRAVPIAAVVWAAYGAGAALGALAGRGATSAFAVGGVAVRVAVGWPGLVVAVAALLAASGALLLVRRRGERPRWPWERDEPDE